MASPTLYAEAWHQGPNSTQFYTRTYSSLSPPKAVLVFIHGFAEHIGRYTHFHPLFPKNGITVFTLDQRGFGKTAQDVEGHKSKGSTYGKTSWKEQMGDIEWAVEYTSKVFPGVPAFLMGHSMGGGEVLGFATQGETSSLAGVIATSPLIYQTKPVSRLLRWAGGKASALAPNLLVPADVVAADLSHDVAANDAYLKDPLIKQAGSLRGLHDMLSNGEALLQAYYKRWPKTLPILLVHGTDDKVTSHKATQDFHDKIVAQDKKTILFPGGFHELHNEPDGVKEKLAEDIIAFIDAHLPSATEVTKSKM